MFFAKFFAAISSLFFGFLVSAELSFTLLNAAKYRISSKYEEALPQLGSLFYHSQALVNFLTIFNDNSLQSTASDLANHLFFVETDKAVPYPIQTTKLSPKVIGKIIRWSFDMTDFIQFMHLIPETVGHDNYDLVVDFDEPRIENETAFSLAQLIYSSFRTSDDYTLYGAPENGLSILRNLLTAYFVSVSDSLEQLEEYLSAFPFSDTIITKKFQHFAQFYEIIKYEKFSKANVQNVEICFPNIIENAVLNLLAALFYNQTSGVVEYQLIPEGKAKEYFRTFNTIRLIRENQHVWNNLCINIEGVKYKKGGFQIITGSENIRKVLKYLTNIEDFFVLANSAQRLGKKIQWPTSLDQEWFDYPFLIIQDDISGLTEEFFFDFDGDDGLQRSGKLDNREFSEEIQMSLFERNLLQSIQGYQASYNGKSQLTLFENNLLYSIEGYQQKDQVERLYLFKLAFSSFPDEVKKLICQKSNQREEWRNIFKSWITRNILSDYLADVNFLSSFLDSDNIVYVLSLFDDQRFLFSCLKAITGSVLNLLETDSVLNSEIEVGDVIASKWNYRDSFWLKWSNFAEFLYIYRDRFPENIPLFVSPEAFVTFGVDIQSIEFFISSEMASFWPFEVRKIPNSTANSQKPKVSLLPDQLNEVLLQSVERSILSAKTNEQKCIPNVANTSDTKSPIFVSRDLIGISILIGICSLDFSNSYFSDNHITNQIKMKPLNLYSYNLVEKFVKEISYFFIYETGILKRMLSIFSLNISQKEKAILEIGKKYTALLNEIPNREEKLGFYYRPSESFIAIRTFDRFEGYIFFTIFNLDFEKYKVAVAEITKLSDAKSRWVKIFKTYFEPLLWKVTKKRKLNLLEDNDDEIAEIERKYSFFRKIVYELN